MNDSWRSNFNKLFAGSCGTQLGMLFSCGVLGFTLFVCVTCATSSLMGVTVSRLFRDIASVSQAQADTQQIAPPIEPILQPPAPEQAPAPVSPTPINQPTPLPVVDLLPATGKLNSANPPIVTAIQGRANLRVGPGTDYPRIGVLPQDASLPIVGRNSDMSWWLVSTTEGLLWISAEAVLSRNINDEIPVVDFTVPASSELAIPVGQSSEVTSASQPALKATPTTNFPAGTPTAAAVAQRVFIRDTPGWKKLTLHTGGDPTSEGFHPRGDPLMLMDGVKLHLVSGDGSWSKLLAEGNSTYRIADSGIWSPDGEFIAFAIHYLAPKCRPCKGVAIYNMQTEELTILETPNNLDAEAPRWTQDGRLIILVHPQEPADGIAYEYNTAGQSKIAEGTYLLSASHDGQKWNPWLPGREWTAGTTYRGDAYYRD